MKFIHHKEVMMTLYSGKNKEIAPLVALLVGCFATPNFAMPSSIANFPAHIVFQAGAFDAAQGKSQHINIQDLIGDQFTLKHKHDQNGLLGLGVFVDGCDTSWASLMYGVNAFYLMQTEVKGNVIQENIFTNLAYKYNITNYPIYVIGKALFHSSDNSYNFTLDLGLGPNFIVTNNFKETSLDDITIPDDAFGGKTHIAFSGTLGLGVRFNNVFNCMPLEIGYRFFYLGEGQLHKETNQILTNFKTGNSYANALIISLTY